MVHDPRERGSGPPERGAAVFAGRVLHQMHYRGLGILGIHAIHYPAWKLQKYLKQGVAAPERVERASVPAPPASP